MKDQFLLSVNGVKAGFTTYVFSSCCFSLIDLERNDFQFFTKRLEINGKMLSLYWHRQLFKLKYDILFKYSTFKCCTFFEHSTIHTFFISIHTFLRDPMDSRLFNHILLSK